MKIDILAAATALSDHDLLTRLVLLAARERESAVDLLAHLAALDTRPWLYAAQGHGSLFAYCTRALRLSEDAACNRIEAARACRRFPVILDRLAEGSLSLTSVRLLARLLTPANHEAVLARACGRSRREIEALGAELAPGPDVPSTVRRLPPARSEVTTLARPTSAQPEAATSDGVPAPPAPAGRLPPPRAVVQASAPARYKVQFTIGEETHERLRRLQALLRREIPDGDPAAIFGRAVTLLLDKVEKDKLGAAARPRPLVRPGTDDGGAGTRHVPREVRRQVWRRDGGRCAFVSATGVRCAERAFLEWHHVQPYSLKGPATAGNIALRCRRHNQLEAQLDFRNAQSTRAQGRG
jgi:hypothetical protein